MKKLSNTNLFALRHMLRNVKGKVSLPVHVRRSKTPLLKFPKLCCGEAGEKEKESALSIFSSSLCGGERSQRENSLRGRRSKGKGKGIRTQANSKMIHVQQTTRPLPSEQWFLQWFLQAGRYNTATNHNYNKIVKSDWLSTALI